MNVCVGRRVALPISHRACCDSKENLSRTDDPFADYLFAEYPFANEFTYGFFA